MVIGRNIKSFKYEDRPREKLKKYGAANLSNKELLAIMLRTGTKNINVIELADNILEDIGGINNLRNVTYNELVKHKGIGHVKAIDILASIEFVRRIFTEDITNKITCNSPEIVANYLRYKLQELKQEVFLVIDLDVKGRIIEEREVFRGSLDMSLVHPREVFKNSIKNSAASIICVHNHPSGDATPSSEDVTTTYKLLNVGNLLGIEVLDHIVVAKTGYCSLRKVLNILENDNITEENFSGKYLKNIINKYKLVKTY